MIYIGFGLLYAALKDHQWSSIGIVLFIGIISFEMSFFWNYLWYNAFYNTYNNRNGTEENVEDREKRQNISSNKAKIFFDATFIEALTPLELIP